LIIGGILYAIFESNGFPFKSTSYKFSKISDSHYSITDETNKHSINVIYGKIDGFKEYDKDTLVILPANDSFDDACVDDERSVLGSFVKKLYPDDNTAFKEKINTELQKKNQNKFEIGDWIYLHDVHKEKKFKVGIVSCTHLNEDKSIIAYSINVMLAFRNGIFRMIQEKRINKVYIPLIGSGHGGLSPEISFLNLLISFIEGLSRSDQAHRLSNVNIVIYQNDKGKCDIVPKKMKNIVKLVLNYCR
jgi:hypothetical protein